MAEKRTKGAGRDLQKSIRLSAKEREAVTRLAREDETTEADAIRRAIREAARRRKLL